MSKVHPLYHLNFLPVVNVGDRTPWCSHSEISSFKSTSLKRRAREVVAKRGVTVITCQRGFGGGFLLPKRDYNMRDFLPSPDTRCACSSKKTYGKCCRRFHTAQGLPQRAEELLRSRYSAYAYRLPSYIMKTTHRSMAELDRRKWKGEILDFCREYQFLGGVDILDEQITGPSTTRILFR